MYLELEPFGYKKNPTPHFGVENSALAPLGPPSPPRAQPPGHLAPLW